MSSTLFVCLFMWSSIVFFSSQTETEQPYNMPTSAVTQTCKQARGGSFFKVHVTQNHLQHSVCWMLWSLHSTDNIYNQWSLHKDLGECCSHLWLQGQTLGGWGQLTFQLQVRCWKRLKRRRWEVEQAWVHSSAVVWFHIELFISVCSCKAQFLLYCLTEICV